MRRNKYGAKKRAIDGIEFDSIAESKFYEYLKKSDEVKRFTLQPSYEILERYETRCVRCRGVGTVINLDTGNTNKCTLCKGKGRRYKSGATYTADFAVEWLDGTTDIIDVKGGPTANEAANLRRRMFEAKYEIELLIVERKNGQWLFKR